MNRYFLSATLGGETVEREVTLEEFCKAERAAGFRPKLWSGDPAYMTTPATGGFGGSGIRGRVEYHERVFTGPGELERIGYIDAPNDLGNRRDAGPYGGASVLTDELEGKGRSDAG